MLKPSHNTGIKKDAKILISVHLSLICTAILFNCTFKSDIFILQLTVKYK